MELEQLDDGVYVWLVPHGPNAGVVADADGLTVVDTLMVQSQWMPFAAAVTALGAPIRRVVLTSSRIDHVGGTKAFPNAAVYGTQDTSDALELPMAVDAYRRVMPEYGDELDDLAMFGTRTTTHLVTDAASLTPRVDLIPMGVYTDGDLMAQVSDGDGVVFTGDLLWKGEIPLAFEANFDAWVEALDLMAGGGIGEVFVPGHGPVCGLDDVEVMRDYLRACNVARGNPDDMRSGPWDAWTHPERTAINIERAELLRTGRDELPASMRKLLDLT